MITAPATSPVTLVEAKWHLKVETDEDDALITDKIASAVGYLDGPHGVLRAAIEPQTWEMALDKFPASEIRLPLGPVASVSSVKYTDADGVEQTVAPEDYEVDLYPDRGWIIPSAAWPATMATVNAVRVQWVAGTGCPASVKQAILLLVGHWYANREAVGVAKQEIPLGVASLIGRHRRALVLA